MYYSPILFSEIADLNLTQYHDCSINMEYLNSKDRIIIFCVQDHYLNHLFSFLDKVEKPFILISAMEDQEFPAEVDTNLITKIKSSPYFKHWFSVNKTIPNDSEFTSIPYGLDYWTVSTRQYFGENVQDFKTQNLVLENIANNSLPFYQRIPKIFSNFNLHFTDTRYGGWRRKLIDIIPKEIIDYQQNYLVRSESYKYMSKYSFVVSPFGHGYDCIRTFEALCLGCIVIMKKSFLDIIYEDLPVLLVDEWTDINETLLNETLELYKNKKFNYDKLKIDYWIELVNSKF